MQKNLIVVDNFYTNVDATRQYILSTDFDVTGNYPGMRTKSYATDQIKSMFEDILQKKITHWPSEYNGSFQYTTKNMDSWIHRDRTRYAAILYLTPDAPVSSGTGFFKHKKTGIETLDDYNKLTPELKAEVDSDGNKMDKWDMVDLVGNKYNRLIIFNGYRNHRSMEYFGTNKFNGRLFQVWFFDVNDNKTNYIKSIPRNISTGTKNICILFFSTSRYEYLIPTLESFHQNVAFPNSNIYKILIDDYPLRRDTSILEKLTSKFKIDKLILNSNNLGYSASWKIAWENVPDNTDYIWHQEDDFTFNEIVDANKLINILENKETELFQVVLKRNVVFETNDFIDNVEKNKVGKEVDIIGNKMVINREYFNSNPCIYPYWITKEKYSYKPQETLIRDLCNTYPNGYSALYGSRNSKNIINHIGEYTQGSKVSPGEPGWERLKEYDPEKKYYSNKYLQPYNSNS